MPGKIVCFVTSWFREHWKCSIRTRTSKDSISKSTTLQWQSYKSGKRERALSPDIIDSLKCGLHQVSLEESSTSERIDLC